MYVRMRERERESLVKVMINVGGNNIRNRDGTSERSEILLKKYMEPLVRAKELEKGLLLPRVGENEEWWSRALGVYERVPMLYESMNFTYLDVWEDFVESFKLYKRDGVHLMKKARRMEEGLSLAGKTFCTE